MQIIIIATSYYDFDNCAIKVGGAQTYIRDLSLLSKSLAHDVTIIQFDNNFDNDLIATYKGIKIINKHIKYSLQKHYFEIIDQLPNSFIILSSDQIPIKIKRQKGLQIQHGIAFDIPGNMIQGFWGKTKWLQIISKWMRCWKNVRRFKQAPHTVCVDYNYYNWLRTLCSVYTDKRITIIPNYASQALSQKELEEKLSIFQGIKKIVFARRFVDYRGTLLFANIIPQILHEYPYIEITFAGDGPLEPELYKRFGDNPQIKFTKFDSANSLDFHRNFDLAIVPTIFSEGTSLSLCEAMAAGCGVICTHVGGMTNIVLDGFNGLSIYPSEQDLLEAIRQVVNMPHNDFTQMARNGHACATSTFSHAHWSTQWKKILESYS